VTSATEPISSDTTMSDYDSSDSELNRAIALSLEDIKRAPVINLLSDDERDDPSTNTSQTAKRSHVRSAKTSNGQLSNCDPDIQSSDHAEASGAGITNEAAQNMTSQETNTSRPLQTQYGLSSMAGADRKRMEEERLARARKRKAVSISPPPLSRQAGGDKQSSQSSASAGLGVAWHSAKKGKTNQQSPSGSGGQGAIFPVPRSLVNSKPTTLCDSGTDSHTESQERSLRLKESSQSHLPGVLSYKQQEDLLAPGIHFLDGVVKKTWAYGCPRQDDIKIEEVLQKDDLEMAVLSAYQWDDEWILRKMNLRKTKVICVVQAETEQQKAQMRANVPQNIRFCFPSMEGQINCMHSKLQLLSHPTHLRIVVPSANLMPYDWGEGGGVMENIVFMIDLPRLPDMQKITVDEITPFGRELLRFLSAMEMEQGVKDSILHFDFSKTSHLAFIHSIGGSHCGTAWKHTGYCGLGSAIQELGLGTKQSLEIDIVSASIGNITENFLKSIYLAAQGDDGTTELNWRTSEPPQNKTLSKQSRGQASNAEVLDLNSIKNNFRLYFPSRETVANSKGGLGAGGTICFQSRWFQSATFPRYIMRDCKSTRPGLLMHNKMLFVRPRNPLPGIDRGGTRDCVAWAYLGSANLSESAWGRLVKDKATKQPKLNIRNWECGVVVPVLTQQRASEMEAGDKGKGVDTGLRASEAGPPGMDIFEGIIPVPMAVPGEDYDRKRPWFFSEQ